MSFKGIDPVSHELYEQARSYVCAEVGEAVSPADLLRRLCSSLLEKASEKKTTDVDPSLYRVVIDVLQRRQPLGPERRGLRAHRSRDRLRAGRRPTGGEGPRRALGREHPSSPRAGRPDPPGDAQAGPGSRRLSLRPLPAQGAPQRTPRDLALQRWPDLARKSRVRSASIVMRSCTLASCASPEPRRTL